MIEKAKSINRYMSDPISASDKLNPIVPEGWEASTYLSPYIRTYDDMAHRIKVRLGYPDLNITVSDEAIATNINEAIEMYSRYAGYDQEFLVFKHSLLNKSCEVKLDDLVDACYTCAHWDNPETACSGAGKVVWEDILTSTEVTETILGMGRAYVNNSTKENIIESEILNVPDTKEIVNTYKVKYDPQEPWDFDAKDANFVNIYPLSSYPERLILSPVMDAWINVKDGVGEIYPPNWEDKDPCGSIADWWGLSGYDDTWTPAGASHVVIGGVPIGTVDGLHPLEINTGKGATFIDCKGLDTGDDYMNATVQFVIDYDLPSELSGRFDIEENKGFTMKLKHEVCEAPDTPFDVPVKVEFGEYLSSFGYNHVSSFKFDAGFYDENMNGQQRKVTNVFTADPAGNEAGSTLFNFEYAFAQGLLGYDGMGNRFYHTGYDLVSYDIGRQYIETVKRLLGHSSISCQFNKRTQKLRIYNNYANSAMSNRSAYIIGVWIEKPVAHIIQEPWVLDYATALTKITLGNVITRFQGAQSLGGISINGNDILTQGTEEKKELLEWLRNENSEGGISVPFYME